MQHPDANISLKLVRSPLQCTHNNPLDLQRLTSLKKYRASSEMRSAASSDRGGGDRAPLARPSTPWGDATANLVNMSTASCAGRWSQRLGVLEVKLMVVDIVVLIRVSLERELALRYSTGSTY
jgi:hypothetical protein